MPPEITDFATLFRENCAACHGIEGKNGPGRPLNDALYLSLIPKETLQHTIENGIPGTAMPAWARAQGGPLYPNQIAALVNGIEQNWAKPVNLRGATFPPYSAGNDPGDPARGKRLFIRACFMCHGKGAKVGPVTEPSFLALVSDQGLRTSVIIGRPDLGMPDWRFLNLGHALTDQDIADIVAYLISQRPRNVQTGTRVIENRGSGDLPATPENQSGNQGSGGQGAGNARTR
jgi:cytochrome c oxidase cbb3-type subunit 3